MLQEDDSLSMMLFFGFVGALNAVCLAPVLLILHLAGFVSASGLTLRVFALTVCKGAVALPLTCKSAELPVHWCYCAGICSAGCSMPEQSSYTVVEEGATELSLMTQH